MSSYPFAHCLEPYVTKTKDGREVLTSCGKCHACLNKKNSRNQRLCELEQLGSYSYTYFCTLTYDNDHIPYYELVEDEDDGYYLIDRCVRSLTYGEYVFDEPIRIPYKDRAVIKYKVDIPYPNSFGYLHYRDIQLFNKSFRKAIKKYTHANIRYYATGEYGPDTLRPHWHIIYFSDAPLPGEINEDLVRKIWKKAIKVEFDRCKGGAVGYASAYVNSTVTLPSIYHDAKISSRSAHSVRLGAEFVKDNLIPKVNDVLLQTENRGIPLAQNYTINGYVKHLPMDRTHQSALYPKPYRFELVKRDCSFLGYLRAFEHYSEYLGKELTVKDLTNKLYDYLLSLPSLDVLAHKDHYTDYDKGFMEYLDFPLDWLRLSSSLLTDDKQLFYDRLYRIMLFSKQYIERCKTIPNYMSKLLAYYDRQEYQLLLSQYRIQTDYFLSTDTDDISPFYDAVFSLEKLKSTMMYSEFATQQGFIHHKKISKKKMNDLARLLNP